ncbi:MAG TPA: type 1 glutamine amidotransferase [Propionibacteriaceae bacterium]|nr:type 1 glutamine amidotransferase [Propionibacteriaceae bacterium]
MRVLLIQHDHICTPGYVGERLTDRGLDLVLHQVVREDRFLSPDVEIEFPDPTDFDAIVPMGAPWSVYDHQAIGTWVPAELKMLRAAHDHQVPVLGICFGGQMLAAAHGGSVSRSAAPEIGWVEVDSDDESLVLSGLWFQWHYDQWQLPNTAQEVARNPSSSQAFVLGRNLAVQFHPEMTSEILASWIATGGAEEITRFGIKLDDLVRQTADQDAANRERAHRLVDQFLDRVAARPELSAG